LIFATLFDELSIVIKKELLQIPVAGLYFRRLGCIPIDRSSGIKAIKSLITFGKRSIDERVSILIFPNGTRSSANEETEFKGGIYAMYKAFSVPVILVKIDSGKCWPRRSFRKYPGIINMEFKPPIAPGLSKEAFMEKIAENL
jgi:1-acyl-sn-glycerol-3-phosphate acyltransferase